MSLIKKISLLFRKKNQNTAREEEGKLSIHDYVGKFVRQHGSDIGESIAVQEKRLIVKHPDGFMSVPFEAVVNNSDHIEVGDFNREESLKLGKEWFDRKDVLQFDENGMPIIENRDSK